MKVLVIGGGGREHAICWALRKSPQVTEIVCAPGNGGIASIAKCVPVKVDSLVDLVRLGEESGADLTIVGPEVPLSVGVVDEFMRRGWRIFGPTQAGARLETSKSYAKDFMRRYEIPTAAYAVCYSLDEVREQMREMTLPVVVKADGLAAGKGVVICETLLEAERAAAEIFGGDLLGYAETTVVLEEFLVGEEVSFFALCDGKTAVPIAAAQDHKRIGEGDTGPNTGGMGAYCTDDLISDSMREWLTVNVAQKTVDGMRAENDRDEVGFRGMLFCGMMMTAAGPMVLEFNTRFGDPETQAIMMRLETDVVDLFDASIDGRCGELSVQMKPGASACVVMASVGYPGSYEKGLPITGLEKESADVEVFHAGTAVKDGAMVTSGGRVLGVTAVGSDLKDALRKAYARVDGIAFEGMQVRRDIGWRRAGRT